MLNPGIPGHHLLTPPPPPADHFPEMPDPSAGPTPLQLHNQDGHPICSLDEWFRLAPPARGAIQWKDGRSAKETARAWLRSGIPALPAELAALFDSHPLTHSFLARHAIPEAVIRLDDLAGNQRNADMLVVGDVRGQNVVVTVESKVDESFGERIGEYYDCHPPPASRVRERIDALARAVFGRALDDELRQLRYQLLHGTAGTLVAAAERGAGVAVFVAHVFETPLAEEDKLSRNKEDWDRFVRALSGLRAPGASVGVGGAARLLGPFTVAGGGRIPPGLHLLVGECRIADSQHLP